MKKSRDRLGEKDTSRSGGDGGLSPSLSTKQKQLLWNRLKEVDKKISKLASYYGGSIEKTLKSNFMRLYKSGVIYQLEKLDENRKNIRNKLKGYK